MKKLGHFKKISFIVFVVIGIDCYRVLWFNERANCRMLCYIKKKRNTGMRTRILMSFKKFNDSQKDNPFTVSSYMEENSCK